MGDYPSDEVSRFIYQVGRFDGNYTKNLRFVYDGSGLYEKPLSSLALKEHFGGDTKVVLVYPVSIVYNKGAVDSLRRSDDFACKILCNIDSYLSEPEEVLKHHPHNRWADDFVVIHSLGKYRKPDVSEKEVEFKGTYNDIVLGLLCDLIERYLCLECGRQAEFYFDISSGHNVYVAALLEAARHFSVFSKLFNWQDKSLRPRIFVVFSDPIVGSVAEQFRLYAEEMKFKVFFYSPVGKTDFEGENKLSKRLFPDCEDEALKRENRKKRKVLDEFCIVFSALKNNTPLVLYHIEYSKPGDIIELLREVVKAVQETLRKNWLKSPNLPKDDYLKAFLALGFYAGVAEVLRRCKIGRQSCGIKLSDIKGTFCSGEDAIYKLFDLELNCRLLGIELYNLEEGYKVDGKPLKSVASSNQWKKLKDFVKGVEDRFNERNFLAHAGFERTVTEIKSDGRDLYLRYSEDSLGVIKEVLRKYL